MKIVKYSCAVLALDAFTKLGAIRCARGVVQNHGSVLSLVQDYGSYWHVVLLLQLLIMAVASWVTWLITRDSLIVGLHIGGAAGNLGERLISTAHGVTDWIGLSAAGCTVTINIADIAIFGANCLLLKLVYANYCKGKTR